MLTDAQRAAAEADYVAYADYESDTTGAYAKSFRAACRKLILSPSQASVGGRSYTRESLQKLIDDATEWLRINGLDNSPTKIVPIGFRRPS